MTKPANIPIKPITIERKIIFLKERVKKLAIDWGTVRREINKIIPTTLIFKTIVSATKIKTRFLSHLTGKPWALAYFSSKEMNKIFLKKRTKKEIKTRVSNAM